MGHDVCHVELATTDPEKAKSFYRTVFAWAMEDVDVEGSPYTLVQTPDGINGGLMKSPNENVPTNWLPYVQVDDIEATLGRVEELGGKVAVGKTKISDFIGHFAVIHDPTGATLGIFEAPAEEG